uniref:Uncharacterized protein n=1 Tax=Romanomermis culicivorax TaxID=13658 RepID=A0A915K3K7_ROMCU
MIELAMIYIIQGKCPLLFVNNSVDGIHLQPNQLIAEVKSKPEELKITIALLSDQDHDHEPAALVNDQSTKSNEEKL